MADAAKIEQALKSLDGAQRFLAEDRSKRSEAAMAYHEAGNAVAYFEFHKRGCLK